MKRLLVAGLLVAALPATAATDVRDLFKALMLDDQDPPVLQSWSFDQAGTEKISWQKPETERGG